METCVVDNKRDYQKQLHFFKPDLVISDYNLPSFNGTEALQDAIEFNPEMPFIIVTGTLGEEKAVDLLKMGATDFVLKDNLPRLPMVVKRALLELSRREQDRKNKEELRLLKEHQRQLFQFAPIGISEMSLDGRILFINDFGKYLFRMTDQMMETKTFIYDLLDAKEKAPLKRWLKEEQSAKSNAIILRNKKKDRFIQCTCIPYQNASGDEVFIGVFENVTESVNTKRQLREKNQLWETLMSTIADVVYQKDQLGKYVMVNRAFEDMFGVKEKDVLGSKDKDFMNLGFASELEEADKLAIGTKEHVRSTLTFLNENGGVVYLDCHNTPILNNRKKVIGTVGTARDITSRVKAEEKLKQSEALLIEAENIANIGSWEFTIKGELITGSVGTMKLFGLSLTKRTWHYSVFINRCHPDDREECLKSLQNAILEGENMDIEHRVIQEEHGVAWVRTKGRIVLNENNMVERIVGTVQDITEQRNTHQRLVMNRQLLNEAQAIAQIGSFDWTIAQNILHCTDQFQSILALQTSSIWPNFDNYIERIHPADRELTRKKIFDALSNADEYDIEHRIQLPNGSVKTVRAIGRVKKDKNGQPDHLLGTIEDISDKREMDNVMIEGQEMERARIAREVHDGIGQLLAATKFNLSALDGMPEASRDEQLDKIHNTLEMTIDEARRITRNLSTKVLDELGLEKAVMELCTQSNDLVGLHIDTEFSVGTVKLSENAKRSVYRMLQESINNMLKYSKATKGLVTMKDECDGLLVCVKDNGVGFDLNDPKVKQGNGLTNLSQRAKVLHGYFNIKSKPRGGTEISITIPYENLNKNE
ncbi:hypothetical protein BFP72_04595 [Reichenbachiella sp. 5M10]|nr:hypothetical protein BFP72_04595 [Reichenbachiella sp. 5M10]